MSKTRKGKKAAERKPAKMGRPSAYSKALANAICTRVAAGDSLRKIIEDEAMPSMSMVMRWLADEGNADFREQYARAREAQADLYFGQIIEIADTPQVGVKTKTIVGGGEKDKDKVETAQGDMIEHRRLQVDARKFVVARLAPKKYGEKLELSGDPERPVSLRSVPAPEMDLGKIIPRGLAKA